MFASLTDAFGFRNYFTSFTDDFVFRLASFGSLLANCWLKIFRAHAAGNIKNQHDVNAFNRNGFC